jgi:SAM-dependent MidA family methyltransferase
LPTFLSSAGILKDNDRNMQARLSAKLPRPDDASQAHSARCAAHIQARAAAAGGSLSFAEFMQEALYAPGLGYYAAGAAKFGASGDFVTAPELNPVFARVVARACADVLDTLGGGDILEFGAGSGRLAVDVLRKLEILGRVPERYSILEVSADLRQRQRALLAEALPHLAARVRWLDRLPAGHRGIVIANEVLDAFPVERFRIRHGVRQLRVGLEGDSFRWLESPAPPALEAAVAAIEADLGRPLEPGYTSEFSPLLEPWVKSVCERLEAGLVLLFDYGASRRDYYAAGRSAGWLQCHFRHHAHADPLCWPGIQDMSCWVDFSAAAAAAAATGASIGGFVTQAAFLLAGGLVDEFEANEVNDSAADDSVVREGGRASSRAKIELAAAVKMLTLPGQMGERFKCLGLSRNLDSLPAAITAQDRTHTL